MYIHISQNWRFSSSLFFFLLYIRSLCVRVYGHADVSSILNNTKLAIRRRPSKTKCVSYRRTYWLARCLHNRIVLPPSKMYHNVFSLLTCFRCACMYLETYLRTNKPASLCLSSVQPRLYSCSRACAGMRNHTLVYAQYQRIYVLVPKKNEYDITGIRVSNNTRIVCFARLCHQSTARQHRACRHDIISNKMCVPGYYADHQVRYVTT